MSELQEKELRIIEGAFPVFMRFGIKSVNMDDMARHLSISKKTLYQFVKDKEDLVKKVTDFFCRNEETHVKSIADKGYDAIEESLEIMKWVAGILQNIHPSVMYDLEKYHPEAALRLKENRNETIHGCVIANLKKGQKEGLYRKDFNPDVITKNYIILIDQIFNHLDFPSDQYKPSELYKEIFKYHIRGIASRTGIEYLREKMKSIKI